MSHLTIRLLYQQRLAAWAADKALRVAYQGAEFVPEVDETYLSCFALPAGTDTNTLAGDHRVYTGVFQINVVTPVGNGSGDAEGLVEELADVFPAYLRLAQGDFEVIVLTPVEPGPVITVDTTLSVSASFQYRADTE
ncbi:MAG TPA: phage tail terminator-like protein [Pseudomonas sp.]|jgi:hypothetical protein